MFCGKCGTENPNNYSFCSACGFPLRSVRLDAPDATSPTAAGRDDTHATIEPAQLPGRATQADQAQSSKPGRKRNSLLMWWLGPTLLPWLLWWRIDQDELNKQVAEYESMRMTRSAKGQSFLLLNLTAWLTMAFIVFAHLSAVDLSEALIALVLGYFIYSGHRWASIAAMVFWSIAKWGLIWATIAAMGKPVDNPVETITNNPVEMIMKQLVWWCIYMHAFYLAFRVEGLRLWLIRLRNR